MGKVKDALFDAMQSMEFMFTSESPINNHPLTDEEICELWKNNSSIFEFARAIERKHGINNDNKN
jgi:hypothetical protein